MAIRFLPFRFRDIEAPFQDRRVGFAQDVARHPILFRDLKEIEMLGADNLTISYTLPMDDAANMGRWRDVNLYTDVLAEARPSLLRPPAGHALRSDLARRVYRRSAELSGERRHGGVAHRCPHAG